MRPIDQNLGSLRRKYRVPPGPASRPAGILFLLLTVTVMAASPTAFGHHSFAQRVAGELQSIEIHDGMIELYKLLNPHSALIVRVDGNDAADGDAAGSGIAGGDAAIDDTVGNDTGGGDAAGDGSGDEDWLIELSSASTLSREGWTDDFLSAGDRVSIAILASRTPNRGRLRAMLVHADSETEASRLIVAYGIRGDTPIMRRLRERLPTCEGIDPRLQRGECFTVAPEALRTLEQDFPGKMGYILP